MTRTRFASSLTRLISGENRMTTSITALCLTILIVFAGFGLAQAAHGVRSQLAGSEILARLTRREPADPRQTAVFLRYLNAMAPAVLNLEIPPEEQVRAFQTVYGAARKWKVALRDFSFKEGRLDISCASKDVSAARQFYDEVKAAGKFSGVTAAGLEDLDDFIIICDFIT